MAYRRRLWLAVGAEAGIALGVAWVTHLWGLDPLESWAIVFAGAVLVLALLGGMLVGAGTACLATAAYLGMRLEAIYAVGFGPLASRIALWAGVYVTFGLLGGWASGVLGTALGHLEDHNRVDPETGLGNARRFLDLTGDVEGSEMERLRRFGTAFSVISYTLDPGGKDVRSMARALRGEMPRKVDHVCHAALADGRHLFGFVLPGTSMTGAETVGARLDALFARLLGHAAPGAADVEVATLVPGSGSGRGFSPFGIEHLTAIRARFLRASVPVQG